MMDRRDLAHLPADFSTFIGREAEIGELRQLISSVRAVTLCGAGGIGKTRLALRILAELADDFPDGVWFVELGEMREPELVVSRVASVIGVEETPGMPLLDTLAEVLRNRRTILALDNCEHLITACASLCQRMLASAPGLQVIATSREPLRVAAEAVWHVPPLEVPPTIGAGLDELHGYDAIRLFAERAAAAAPGFTLGPSNAPAVAAICQALDGLPLGIELAAAWVRVLSVEQIAARLDDRFILLTRGDRTAPPRQQTLRATVDWSYDLLSGPEQVLLRRLSVFAGWSLEMAEKLCADDILPGGDILDLMTALADKSLLEVEPEALGQVRYRMLESIREYASSRLEAAGEADALRSLWRESMLTETEGLLAIGMALVPAPWSARLDVFRRFDLEAENTREMLSNCLADGDAESGMRLCTAIRPCWIVRGTFREGADWMDAFLGLERAADVPPSVRGPALAGRAQLAMALGSERAEEWAMAGLELCWAAGEQFWAAAALNLLTEIALHSGRTDEAQARADEALTVARSAGDRWNEGYALGTSAAVAGRRGSLREAQQLSEQALAIMRDIDQRWGCARVLLGLGDLARLRSDPGTATGHYLEALLIAREVNAKPEIARCLAGLGRMAMEQADLGMARQHLAESMQLSYASGSMIGMARSLEALAQLSVLEGSPQNAIRLAGAVTTLRQQAHLPPVPGSRTQRYLDSAESLGEHAVARLWADGMAMGPPAAVRLALGSPADFASPGTGTRAPDTSHPAGPAAGRSGGPAGGLTAREREVVSLLADGQSNRAIAEALFISPATAARHVANILAKLGFSSRSQVAVWARSADADRPAAGGHET